MKVLLTAINAKYIHSNLAILYLKAYAKKYNEHIELLEVTINNEMDYILSEIYKKKPDVIAFSSYIWNIGMIMELSKEIRKVLPNTKIWLGGPEVSYNAAELLKKNPFLDGIMIGEGEVTFHELLDYYVEKSTSLDRIRGIAFRLEDENIKVTAPREPMNLSDVPFPYENMEEFKNKIIYYETSRGCPYSCSYCLSSIEKKVRLRDISLVEKELGIFLANKIPQVKFVDRTFNCNRKHALAIWNYIKEHDNGITNFHFEISADILSEEELNLLNTLRKGLIQLEIGVQSTNPKTIEAINRKMDFSKLAKIVDRIEEGNNIHQHLDLIVGLPYEDYKTFQKSFNEVYALRPNQLQLGFLKILKGSEMYYYSKKNTIIYRESAPYEVLYTDWITFDEVLQLKDVEEMVEVYYNSGQFTYTIQYLEHFFATPFDLYKSLGDYYEENSLFHLSHSRISRYYILLEYCNNKSIGDQKVLEELLIYDLYLRENLKSRPDFAKDNLVNRDLYRGFYQNEELVKQYLTGYEDYSSKQISRVTHMESFDYDLNEAIHHGKTVKKESIVLFDYNNREPLNHDAKTIIFAREEL
ncbi:B12-binding domain-containing radical SAM protein [Anaeromicropila herbilytica]|uniref:B12-binding domain-containing radical SAM protein n=1 Tax=Anaeromicropila herbilytica TaxID=2785025 RepID=A0A7R7EHV1_9FIRM|nr:B12-binding domain-containing radical SAM protein [Anaeromicropila herbilytica]BCN29141.1 B12-binding domain-containing radical SAM protein [Anaeromicropila herbilytica]